MITDDFALEQVELLTRFLRTILYAGNQAPEHYAFSENALELQCLLVKDIGESDYNGAENRLFDALELDQGDDMLRLALWFYDKLLQTPKEQLEAQDFSHLEVLEGLQEIEKLVMG